MAIAIRKNLLIHEIEISNYNPLDNQDNYDEFEIVKNVRLEPVSNFNDDSISELNIKTNYLMFVDVLNSEYSSIDIFKIGSVVKFEEKEFKIAKIDKLYTTTLHHLEVYLT